MKRAQLQTRPVRKPGPLCTPKRDNTYPAGWSGITIEITQWRKDDGESAALCVMKSRGLRMLREAASRLGITASALLAGIVGQGIEQAFHGKGGAK